MATVTESVAEKLAQAGPTVREKVLNALTEKEITRRSNAIIQALGKLDDLEVQLKKVKPDQTSFDESGNKLSETYSQKRLEERTKLSKNIKRYQDAINTALEHNKFEPLESLQREGNTTNPPEERSN